jgi:hypothetical protein
MLSVSRPESAPSTAFSAADLATANEALSRIPRATDFVDELPPPLGLEPTSAALTASSLFQHQQLDDMHSENWAHIAQFSTPKMGRIHHQRESSLSSVGSTTGPASPFNHNSSNPQIAFTDSANDLLPEMHSQDPGVTANSAFFSMNKGLGAYPGYQGFDQAIPEMAYPLAIPGPGEKHSSRQERGLLPAPEFNGHTAAGRPNHASSSGSNAGDSPTPTALDAEVGGRRRGFNSNVPKLDRTMTDIFSDELYNPNFTITSTAESQPNTAAVSQNDIFNQRISAANSQHLSAAQSPVSNGSRDRSPFRTGSPFAHQSSNMGIAPQGSAPFNSAQRMREQTKAAREAALARQHIASRTEPHTPPKTISPKDAILEFNDTDGDPSFPLFPQDTNSFEMDQFAKSMMPQGMPTGPCPPLLGAHPATSQLGYMPSQMSTSLQVPQQYPFIARAQGLETPPRLGSTGSSTTGSSMESPGRLSRPLNTAADSGTYTCTYHGCTLRFDTPALLQKHKREGHRQVQGLAGSLRPQDLGMGMTSSLLNSQAGPHRCDRINPSTGKPCGTIFSRPYDLTRHEDTIHNARKQKVRCDLCTEEKTFSRADALTRHYRVCHPHAEVPGKQRRRPRV